MSDMVCIPCCKEKSNLPGKIPAITRYLSQDIKDAYMYSKRNSFDFRILSGKYGLLSAGDTIPDYDQALEASKIKLLTGRVVEQLNAVNPSKIVYFTKDTVPFPGWRPYFEVITASCDTMGIQLEIMTLK